LLLLGILIASHIINPLSLRILQQFIGVDHFLKLFLGPRVHFVPIRMVFFGSAFEALLDLVLIGISGYS
jgi:hypothetical protein